MKKLVCATFIALVSLSCQFEVRNPEGQARDTEFINTIKTIHTWTVEEREKLYPSDRNRFASREQRLRKLYADEVVKVPVKVNDGEMVINAYLNEFLSSGDGEQRYRQCFTDTLLGGKRLGFMGKCELSETDKMFPAPARYDNQPLSEYLDWFEGATSHTDLLIRTFHSNLDNYGEKRRAYHNLLWYHPDTMLHLYYLPVPLAYDSLQEPVVLKQIDFYKDKKGYEVRESDLKIEFQWDKAKVLSARRFGRTLIADRKRVRRQNGYQPNNEAIKQWLQETINF